MNNEIPDINLNFAVKTCPCCGSKISPIYITHHVEHFEDDTSTYYVICQCPDKSCNEVFFVKYTREVIPLFEGINGVEYGLNIQHTDIYPYSFPDDFFEECIVKLSPKFIEAYKQSALADKMELNKICGSGYRLSLELLIKDFAAYLNPDKASDIKKDTSVANVINNRIPNNSCFNEIKDIANRTWWLSCDSAHYDSKYNELDINDLKECINITVASIVFYLKREHYLKVIQKSKP